MRPRKTLEFKRGLKTLATDNGWLVEIVSDDGRPTERIIMFYKDGYEPIRIASFILRQNEKEIDQAIARKIVRNIREIINYDNRSTISLLDERRVILITWIEQFFEARAN